MLKHIPHFAVIHLQHWWQFVQASRSVQGQGTIYLEWSATCRREVIEQEGVLLCKLTALLTVTHCLYLCARI
jgi:hypothetical protein